MGFFKALKSAVGITPALAFVVEEDGRAHLGAPYSGKVLIRADKPVNAFTVGVRLIHTYPGAYGVEEMEIDQNIVAERVSFSPGDALKRPFELHLPVQAVPTLAKFGWHLEFWAALEGGKDIIERLPLEVHWAELTGAVINVLTRQFGFRPLEHNADEDGLWVEFAPDPAVAHVFRKLVCSFDEDEDALILSINLQNFQPGAIRHLGKDFDPTTNSATLVLQRKDFVVKNADFQGIFKRLQPVFSTQ